MSPFRRPVILDNDVLSRLHSAGAVRRVLECWPKGSFCVSEQVIDEATRWAGKGHELVAILKDLEAEGVVTFMTIDESSEEELSAYTILRLGERLGSGESASIAIASHRGFDIATDDGIAREVCHESYPSVFTFGTGDLLNTAVEDGIMTRSEVNSIQAKIRRL
jgi:predicted nucleic acid-binding protein